MKIRYMAAIPVLLTFLLSNVFAADGTTTKVWKDYVKNGPVVGNLPDFHTAGCAPERLGAEKGKTYNVTDYGANPKDRENDRDAIQRAIDTAGAAGGGIVYFPEGRYYIPGGNESNIIQVRHSNIILRGPGLDSKGRQQAILFLQRVSQGKKGGLVGRDEPDHRENGCIMIKGENSGKMVATLTSDGKRGDTVITVDSTKALSQGQIISISGLTFPTSNVNTEAGNEGREQLARTGWRTDRGPLTQPPVSPVIVGNRHPAVCAGDEGAGIASIEDARTPTRSTRCTWRPSRQWIARCARRVLRLPGLEVAWFASRATGHTCRGDAERCPSSLKGVESFTFGGLSKTALPKSLEAVPIF